MSIAIKTTYLPVTNHRGSRIRASVMASLGRKESVTVSYYALADDRDKHVQVAEMLVERLGWGGRWVGGDAGDSSYVFVKVWDDPAGLTFTVEK